MGNLRFHFQLDLSLELYLSIKLGVVRLVRLVDMQAKAEILPVVKENREKGEEVT